jgi:hypothetical protein
MAGYSEPVWRKSSYCDSSACLEIAALDGQVYVRHSENPDGPWLIFAQDAWKEFVDQVRLGAFDSE